MSLTAEQMARMSRLLDEALPLDAARRREWLQALATDHRDIEPALRNALLSDMGESAVSDLDAPPRIRVGAATVVASGLVPGQRVGPYVLLRLLGAGGMAEVWLGQRADGAFKRDVALKLPLRTWTRRDLEQRFARERDILAGLEHANIARLYDGGITDAGLPFLAMEFVPGEPLTTWCDARRLGISERIRLFLQVLDAVHYAHLRNVVHRDIKPSNVLVTEAAQVRLLDFGVAKLLAGDAQGTELTEIYGRALTPDYASPEHLRGDPVGAASDTYSLGVMLYETLAGARPYRLRTGASQAALERAIEAAQVDRPSAQVAEFAGEARGMTQADLVRRLRGDIDAIVLKALARAPERRYPSAAAFAEDLQRHLAGKPVQARPDSLAYRAGRFVMRRWIRSSRNAAGAGIGQGPATAGPEARMPPVAAARPTSADPQQATAPEKSIAVLPFVDMSEKRDQEYFSDGLSEELINLLCKVPGLHVAARTSAFSFKGRSEAVPAIGAQLRVANVLEGSVRKVDNRLRVTVQLVRADNGYHLWSQTYDRVVDDVFRIQDEIAASVVQALRVSLLGDAMPRARGAKDSDAYSLYLQARYLMLRVGSSQDVRTIVENLQRSLTLDPTFAPSWALLSLAKARSVHFDVEPVDRAMGDSHKAAQRALELDPTLPDAHTMMARVCMTYLFDWAGCRAHLDHALRIDPDNADALLVAAQDQGRVRCFDAAIALLQKGIATDPLNPRAYVWLSHLLRGAGKMAEAKAAHARALELNPNVQEGRMAAGLLLLADDPQAALAMFERCEGHHRLYGRALVLSRLDRPQDADTALAQFVTNHGATAPVELAIVHAARGEFEQSFSCLDRAYEQRDQTLWWFHGDPLLHPLRSDPRYQVFLRRMNMAD